MLLAAKLLAIASLMTGAPFFAKFRKKEAKSLEDNDNMLIFVARMRVAYRRDGIKLRNRSLYTKPQVEYLRL